MFCIVKKKIFELFFFSVYKYKKRVPSKRFEDFYCILICLTEFGLVAKFNELFCTSLK